MDTKDSINESANVVQRASAGGSDVLKETRKDGDFVDKGNVATGDSSTRTAVQAVTGYRLVAVTFTLCFGLFLASVETSITATALVSIGEYFHDTSTTTWVVLSYLLSYMGFSIIFARLSDGIGRKMAVVIAWILFSAFALASGLATSLNQLIVFRALQGIGGSGLFSLTMIVLPEISPAKHWGLMSGLVGICFGSSSIVGPILGGVITQKSSWRWIYLFNAPAAVVGLGLVIIGWPKTSKRKGNIQGEFFAQMDVPGALLLLVASTLLVFSVQQAGAMRYSWNSPVIISCLVISIVSWLSFVSWIFWLHSGRSKLQMKSIFPLSIVLSRPTGSAILMAFLTGFPLFVAIISLPLRFQIVNGNTPTMAGVHLLPLLAAFASGSATGGILSSKKNRTAHSTIFAACLTTIGCGLLSITSTTRGIKGPQYGFQFILGFGIGITMSSLTLMIALANDPSKVAAAQGALNQARVLGGSVGLAIGTSIFNHRLSIDLGSILSPLQLHKLQQSLSTISNLEPEQQAAAAEAIGRSFNQQMRMCTYVSAISVLVAISTWQKNPRSVEEHKQRQEEMAKLQEGEMIGVPRE